MTPNPKSPNLSKFSQIVELNNAWQQDYPDQAQGGVLAISGFEYQFLLTLLKIVRLWKGSSHAERQDLETAKRVLAEAISDITETEGNITITQVKITLSKNAIYSALEELWKIFKLASKRTPDLAENLQFVISGQPKEDIEPQSTIDGWGTRKYSDNKDLSSFKTRVRCQMVTDPRADLSTELQSLARNEDIETTISRWSGYLLQLGSGVSSESISAFIWKELANDGSLEAFRATLARLFSLSQKRLCPIRGTLGKHIALPRVELAELQASIYTTKKITLLTGPSGSGKSALCKLGIQQNFKDFDCLFFHASDVASFTESSNALANRGLRRLDELLNARITQKPNLVVIDDLSDVSDQGLNAILNLLQNTLAVDKSANVHFILVVHVDAKHRIHEKIAARLGSNDICADIELSQLPIEELQSSENLPNSVISLIDRHHEFGPALNLKLLDWLVRDVQDKQTNVSTFRNDLDLLTWFWYEHVQNGQQFSNLSQVLIKISQELADQFIPDLPCDFDTSIGSEALHTLVRQDCLRIVNERLATTHRFVGDCARFYYLRRNRREIESEQLVDFLQNPFWVQPIRWFVLQLALEDRETWQELLYEVLQGKHKQLLHLLLDGAILSKQPDSILQECPDKSLPLIIECLINRLLAIATEPYPLDDPQSTSLRTRIAIQEQVAGIPKPDLWEPVWHWLLSQNPDSVLEESCIVFKAAEAWINWSDHAQQFSLRSEVANFTLDLAQKVLLPDPDPEAPVIDSIDPNEIIKLREQGIIPPPKPIRRNSCYLGTFEPNAFSCIVFALRILLERSTWFLRALAGREIVPANKLEPTQISTSLFISGIGNLENPHSQGPSGKVDRRFRKFMLCKNGLFLNAVILTDFQLGVELFFALTIQPPRYRYNNEDFYWEEEEPGISGSSSINICTFKFLPLLSLLEINEEIAIKLINVLCLIVAQRNFGNYKRFEQRIESEESSAANSLLNTSVIDTHRLNIDTHELNIFINGTNKKFYGDRKALYWHRNYISSLKIINCLLMTLEGWLYSRPSKSHLEHSISTILNQSNTVAMIGVLVTLAKRDASLLRSALLPLVSSLQLLIWLEFEQDDYGQNFGFDNLGVRDLSREEEQDLIDFDQLPYRRLDLQAIIFDLWSNKDTPLDEKSKILKNWSVYQLDLIPEFYRERALKIQTVFEEADKQADKNNKGRISFILSMLSLEISKIILNLISAQEINNQHRIFLTECREILYGNQKKPPLLNDKLIDFLTNEEQINFLKDGLASQSFSNVIWAAIATLLEYPTRNLCQELEDELDELANCLVGISISFEYRTRHQIYSPDDSYFVVCAAPKLIKRLQPNSSAYEAAFQWLIGMRNLDTSTFMGSWLREYGVEHPLTKQLINVAPLIARLIELTDALASAKHIQATVSPDGSYTVPRPEEIDHEVSKQENPQVEEAWHNLQSNFVEKKVQAITIVDACGWVPETLDQFIEQMPSWLQKKTLDWDFLAAALIPVVRVERKNKRSQEFVDSLKEQVISALLVERESVYINYKAAQEEDRAHNSYIRLPQAQSQFFDTVIYSNHTNALVQINKVISRLKKLELIDCVLLERIIDALIYKAINSDLVEESDLLLNKQVVFTIGEYLFELVTQSAPTPRILGEIHTTWEKMLELLSQRPEVVENMIFVDQTLKQFFENFQDYLLNHWLVKRKLYRVARFAKYKQFRRTIFQSLGQRSDFLPNCKNDESEILVQVLAELWESDFTWIVEKQTRCEKLKIILGQLQKVDAVGASLLANQVASSIANSSESGR